MRCGSGGLEVMHDEGRGIATYHGLQACGSVWMCPVCSAKISERRRGELNYLLAWGREHGYMPVLMTLTVRHGLRDPLGQLLERLGKAKKNFQQSRSWRRIKDLILGHVTATEVTHGENGWHPHYHMLILLRAGSEAEAIEAIECTASAWSNALRNQKLDCNEHGHMVQGASEAGDYVTKWGAAEEMALTGSKDGKKGRHPFKLLYDYDQGDNQAGALFVEYAKQFKGKRQLVWSPGLKDAIGLEDYTDAQLAEMLEEGDWRPVAHIEASVWHEIQRLEQDTWPLDIMENYGLEALHMYLEAIRVKIRAGPGGRGLDPAPRGSPKKLLAPRFPEARKKPTSPLAD